MPKLIKPSEDQWYGVQDAKERKQIQDRLAQRARRRRLAKLTTRTSKTCVKRASGKKRPEDCKGLCSACHSALDPTRDLTLAMPSITLTNALFHHGLILGLSCGTSYIRKSRPPAPHVPASLRALPIQLETTHYEFIDRFPIPGFRTRMIELADRVSTEEFLGEVFTTPTFSIKPGHVSWDESAWVVAPEFRERWGFLLDYEKEEESKGLVEEVQ